MQSALYFYLFLTKFGFSKQILKGIPTIKFHGNPSSRSRAGTCGETGGHGRTWRW